MLLYNADSLSDGVQGDPYVAWSLASNADDNSHRDPLIGNICTRTALNCSTLMDLLARLSTHKGEGRKTDSMAGASSRHSVVMRDNKVE